MSVPALSAQEAVSEPRATERRPLRELLPTGALRVLVAAAMLAAVVLSFTQFGLSGHALVGVAFAPALVLLGAIDAKHRLLPNAIILPVSVAVGVIVAATSLHSFLGHLAVGAAVGGFFFAFAAFFPGALGMGDAKLVFLLGLALGSTALGAVFVAFAGLLVAALYIVAKRGPAARKETIPFGPFLALGGLVVYFLS